MPGRLTALTAVTALLLAACEVEDDPDEPPVDEPPPPDDEDPDPPDPEDEDPDEDEDVEVEEGAWSPLPDAPIAPRRNHTATWVDGRLYVWGGEDQDDFAIAADGAVYDPEAEAWEELEAAPIEGRWTHEAVDADGELLVFGGTEGPDHLAACYGDGARYDPTVGAWEPVPEAPGEARCGATVAWADGELLVVAGHHGEGPPTPDEHRDDGLAYDPATDEWRELPPAPIEPRTGAVGVWTGEELLVYGGIRFGAGDDGVIYHTDGAAYDPAADAWRELADSPLPPRSGQTAVWVGDELLVFGGDDPDPDVDDPDRLAAAYDPAADEWRPLAGPRWPLTAPEAVWTGGEVVYVLGGQPVPPEGEEPEDADGGEDVPPFVAYVVDEDAWIERPDPPDGPRVHHAMDWTGTQLLVWGGMAGAEPARGAAWSPPAPADDEAAAAR